MANILIVDIETAPILANVWRLWDENVGLEQIRKDRHLLSYAAKWLDSDRIFYSDQSKAKPISDDKQLLVELHALLDEADIVVVQNGRAFDIPTIRARMAEHGLPPPSPFKIVDTYLVAKKLFNFTSNKLQWLAQTLGCKRQKLQHNEFPGFELWAECIAGNKKAWAVMKEYNIFDVHSLEEVYLRLRPWMENHPNVAIYDEKATEPHCPKCGGDVMKRGTRYTNTGTYQSYQCKSCGGYCRGRKLTGSKEHRALQLSN